MPEFWSHYLSWPWNIIAGALLAAGLLFGFIGLSTFLAIWAERKVSGRIQDRLGPTRVGPFGLLQSLADGIKLIAKEDFAPAQADRFLFRLAPYLAFCASFCGFLVLPFGAGLVAYESDIAAFLMLAVLSSEVFGIILAGWASSSKWSLFGGLREAAQVVSYEVPRSLCVVIPVCLAGTLQLSEFARLQAGGFWNWFLFHDPFTFMTFFVFFVTATASCKRAPFDLAEAESELVAGFLVEYSGIRWSYFFLAEYGSMFAVSGLAAYLFLGGWHTGLPLPELTQTLGFWLGNLINLTVFITKCWLLVLVMIWLRWTLPRLRIDQVMLTCLHYLLPIACGLFLGVCLWQLLVPASAAEIVSKALATLTAAFALGVMISLFRAPHPPRGTLPGAWAGRLAPTDRVHP